jgi:hypothetical protein
MTVKERITSKATGIRGLCALILCLVVSAGALWYNTDKWLVPFGMTLSAVLGNIFATPRNPTPPPGSG